MDFVAENNNGISTLEAEINLDIDNSSLAAGGDYSVDLFNPVNNNNWMSDAVINMSSNLSDTMFDIDFVSLDQLTAGSGWTVEEMNDSEYFSNDCVSRSTSTPEKHDDFVQGQWFNNLAVSPISSMYDSLPLQQPTISSEAESFHYEIPVGDLFLQLSSSSTSVSSTSAYLDYSSTVSSPCASLTAICEEYLLESAAKRRCARKLF